MKKYILLGGLLLLSLSACGTERPAERAKVGQIGAESSVSREMAAKTIALAFYTNQELDEMETKLNFSDLSAEDWAYPYIQGCVEQGFFAGSEEGTFRPQADLTLWEAQALMDRLAPDYNSRIVLTAKNKNMAFTREQLLNQVWGSDYLGETRTVDVHIGQLRKKLELFDVIKTIPKIGYRLED